MNRATIRGLHGEVRWAYHRAATVGAWTLTGESLTATVETYDAFAVSQQPLTFVAGPNGSWKWKLATLQVADGTLTATLDPQE